MRRVSSYAATAKAHAEVLSGNNRLAQSPQVARVGQPINVATEGDERSSPSCGPATRSEAIARALVTSPQPNVIEFQHQIVVQGGRAMEGNLLDCRPRYTGASATLNMQGQVNVTVREDHSEPLVVHLLNLPLNSTLELVRPPRDTPTGLQPGGTLELPIGVGGYGEVNLSSLETGVYAIKWTASVTASAPGPGSPTTKVSRGGLSVDLASAPPSIGVQSLWKPYLGERMRVPPPWKLQ